MALNHYSSDNEIWFSWTTASASTTSATASAWSYWTTGEWTTGTQVTDSATTTSDTIWYGWNNGTYRKIEQPYYQHSVKAEVKLTPEQIAEMNRKAEEERVAREARLAEERRKAEVERQKKEEAKKKAYQLLVSLLNEEQVKDLEKTGSFGFLSPSGKVYRIREGWSHNIDLIEGKKKRTLCCHPKKAVPIHDNMTAQLLLLKYQEEEFLKMANRGYEQDVDPPRRVM